MAERQVPCQDCGRPHDHRRVDRPGQTYSWADPDDGHVYRPMSAEQVVGEFNRLHARVVQLEDAIRTHSCGIGIGCWCPGAADGDVHEPGCEGGRATQAERDLKGVLDDLEARQ